VASANRFGFLAAGGPPAAASEKLLTLAMTDERSTLQADAFSRVSPERGGLERPVRDFGPPMTLQNMRENCDAHHSRRKPPGCYLVA
jgi:hypothetical protein